MTSPDIFLHFISINQIDTYMKYSDLQVFVNTSVQSAIANRNHLLPKISDLQFALIKMNKVLTI